MRIDRLLAITLTLLKQERVTARELSERFEVSVRTIYRDIDAMNQAGIPVVPYSGNGGGYSLMENYRLDRRLLKSGDIQAIISSLSGLNRTLGDPNMQDTLDRITSLLPKGTHFEEPGLFEQLVIDIFPWNQNQIQGEKIRLIHQGISESRLLRFYYRGSGKDPGERLTEPMTLVFKGYGWYLFAFCRKRQDFRFFKLNRMKDINIMNERFQRRLVSYESHLPSPKSSGPTEELILDFDASIRSYIEDSFAQERLDFLPDGGIRVTLDVPQNEWVLSMILSYGPMVRVVTPDHIRAEVVAAAQKMISLNQNRI